tara:strand:- start:220 stop:393 length:174 start_codon:yes stop_codon:yes gene_type:complete
MPHEFEQLKKLEEETGLQFTKDCDPLDPKSPRNGALEVYPDFVKALQDILDKHKETN